ncbi:MAG: hypothetical protein ACOYXO_00050 [Chloroflexota bacterium]
MEANSFQPDAANPPQPRQQAERQRNSQQGLEGAIRKRKAMRRKQTKPHRQGEDERQSNRQAGDQPEE